MTNQFNFLRFLAAFLVFYGHGVVLIGESLATILNHKIGLYIFFTISGYLISMSWDRNPNLISFFKKRILRIFPALIFVVLLSVFVLGPIVTTNKISDYFSNEHTYSYLKNILLYISYYLPGVFENNIVPNAVNGSLWSLPVEFMMYIGVALLGIFGRYKKYASLFLFITLAILSVEWALKTHDFIVFYNMDLKSIIYTAVYFWGGATIFHFKIEKHFSLELFVVLLIILIFSFQWSEIYEYLLILILPILTLLFGLSNAKKLNIFNKVDYSYGIYIYAFPVQQTLYYYFPNNNLVFHLSIGFLITLFFSIISWHFIEKPSLKFK